MGTCLLAGSDLLARIAAKGDPAERAAAVRTLAVSAALRARREVTTEVARSGPGALAAAGLAPPPGEHRTVYDAEHEEGHLPGVRERGEGEAASPDAAVNETYDSVGQALSFFHDVFARDSLDGKQLPVVSSVHFGTDYDNALWNGSELVLGDGSGSVFALGAFTRSLDVIAHELTHGVTQFSAGLQYHSQTGALNESMSDVFASLAKQHALGQTAEQADWLIGAGILGSALSGSALRSLKAPGTANDQDQQPAEMSDYMGLPDDGDPAHDHGGVHINSGIPNHAFYLTAMAIGGPAWEKAGRVWYEVLTRHLEPTSDFAAAARATVEVAGQMFTAGGPEQQAVSDAWRAVGVL